MTDLEKKSLNDLTTDLIDLENDLNDLLNVKNGLIIGL